MKRSKINSAILWAQDLLAANNIRLPEYAYWPMDQWAENKGKLSVLKTLMLGWDVSDFGLDNYEEWGAVLYTVRNGSCTDPSVGVPYCEKYIVMQDGQRLPKHYHVFKSEDIINHAGGTLEVFLWNADPKTGKQLETDVRVYQDGILHTYKPGESILLQPGNSISLTPYVAHIFGPKRGTGDLIVGEVSKVNDDMTDNYFLEISSRYPTIEEDAAPIRPLCNEYDDLDVKSPFS